MVQLLKKCGLAALLALSLCGEGLAQSTETSAGAGQTLQSGDDAPDLAADNGVWINAEKPGAISTRGGELTLVVFETVW